MKLDLPHLEILRNFAKINANLAIFPGNSITTVADSNQIAGFFTSPTLTFTEEAGIYDLSQFLSVLGLFQDPEIKQSGTHFEISDANGRKTTFYYAAHRSLKHLQKEINFPEVDVTFDLSKEQLQLLKKAAGTLGFDTICFESKGDGTIVGTVSDLEDPTTNTFSVNIPGTSNIAFKAIYEIKNMQMLELDWKVEFSKRKISRWTRPSDASLSYIVALHKNSTFAGE